LTVLQKEYACVSFPAASVFSFRFPLELKKKKKYNKKWGGAVCFRFSFDAWLKPRSSPASKRQRRREKKTNHEQ
jgi:hypothetical protein